MKKIELNAPLRFVLIILTWLLTFTVVSMTATLSNGGSGLIGTLVIYGAMLFLSFCYFDDCALKKASKTSLLVVVIIAICYLIVQCYGYALVAFKIHNADAVNFQTQLNNIFNIARNIVMAVFLIIALVQAANGTCDCNKETCCKEDKKEVEAPKEEAKKEAEETKEAE